MSLAVVVLKERAQGERRVALDPVSANKLVNNGFQVLIESGAGDAAGFSDEQYSDCTVLDDAEIILTMADIWLWVQAPATEQLANLPEGSLGIGFVFGYRNPAIVDTLREHRLTCIAMELVPRMNRTRSMDALSSQATVTGYKAVLRAATLAPRLFPMLTTAAGTLESASVVIIGAGVAGLQAVATARRLGARVSVYDTHADAREQVESLGAEIIDTGMIDTGISVKSEDGATVESEDSVPAELTNDEDQHDEEQHHEERQKTDGLAEHLAKADVVISTMDFPDRPAPTIITEAMIEAMAPGSVIVDLAAESGGNCELTEPGTAIIFNGVIVDGPVNLASAGATHASEMYAYNLLGLLELVVDGEAVKINREDEVVDATLLTYEGELAQKATEGLTPDSIESESPEDS